MTTERDIISPPPMPLTEAVGAPVSGASEAISAGFFARFSGLEAALQKRPKRTRWVLGLPITLLTTFALMAGMTAWWPGGEAGIDQIAMPIVLFPLIWVGVFTYVMLDDKMLRAFLVSAALIFGNVFLAILA